MKKAFALFLLSLGVLHAQSETVDLRSHGKLNLYISDEWTLSTSDFGDRALVKIEAKDEAVNASISMTVTYPEQDKLSTKLKLKQEVENGAAQMAEGSVEGKAVAKAITLRTGFGYMCNFTDPDLVGKPPQKGNYKVGSFGLIHIAPDVLVEIFIGADSFRGEPYQQLLGAIEGMEFEPGRATRSRETVLKPVVPPKVQPKMVSTMPARTPATAGSF
jgi:hypothetical protein